LQHSKLGVMCTLWVKLLTDLHIFGCKLYRNALGSRAPPGPAGGAIALSPSLGNERESKVEGGNGRGREDRKRGWGARLGYLSRGPRVPSYSSGWLPAAAAADGQMVMTTLMMESAGSEDDRTGHRPKSDSKERRDERVRTTRTV